MPKLISSEGLEQALHGVKVDITTKIDGVEQKLPRDNAIVYTLTHTKSGTVHRLTGLTGTSGIRCCVFKATGSYSAGDTITVDGVSYNIQMSDGKTPETNMFVSGATIPVIVDSFSTKINFKSVGSVEIPIGSTLLMKIFTSSGSFTAPKTGKYKVTAIGRGGNGGPSAEGYDDRTLGNVPVYYGGASGGSGGVAISVISLTQGQSVTVTVNSGISSFGSYCSATVGSPGTIKDLGSGDYSSTGGTGGTASGTQSWSGTAGTSGNSGYASTSGLTFYVSGSRPGHSSTVQSNCPYTSGGADISTSGFYAFGRGGVGNCYIAQSHGSSNPSKGENTPYNNVMQSGITGAVIVEMAS